MSLSRAGWLIACIVIASLALQASQPVADPGSQSNFPWVTDGPVGAVLEHDGVLYIGGRFSRVAPAANLIGGLFRVSQTGEVSSGWPVTNRQVTAVEPDLSGGVFIGGAFTAIDGAPRAYLAHILSNGTIDTGFAPVLSGAVSQLSLGSTHLFVRTGFSITALDPATGAARPWSQMAMSSVGTMRAAGNRLVIASPFRPGLLAEVSEVTGATLRMTDLGFSATTFGAINELRVSGSRVIAGGDFRRDGAPALNNLLAVDLATGAIDAAWAPFGETSPSSGRVATIDVQGTTLYIGGYFTSVGGQPRQHAAAIDIPTGAVLPWDPRPDSGVVDLAVAPDGSVYLLGAFQHVAGQRRLGLASVDANGQLRGWVPGASSYRGAIAISVAADNSLFVGTESAVRGGAVRHNLAAFDASTYALLDWDPIVDVALDVTPSLGVGAIAAQGNSLYFAAPLVAVNGVPRSYAAAVSTGDASLLPWDPSGFAPGGILTLHAAGPHVYAGGSFTSIGGLPPGVSPRNLARLNPITGAADPAWRPDPDYVVRTAVSYNGMLVIAGNFGRVQGAYRAGVAGIDMATGALAPWRPILGPIGVGTGLALDGRTLYLSGSFNSVGGLPRSGSAAVDATSGATLSWDPPRPASSNYGSSVTVADGQLVRPTVRSAGRNVHALQAIAADGSLTSWHPTLGTNLNDDTFETVVTTTPREVIAAGLFHSESGPSTQGITAFARSGSDAPTGLKTVAIAGGVRLQWQAPTTSAPTSYAIEAGSSPGARDVLVQPTGSAATYFDAARPVAGTFFVRVRGQLSTGETTAPSNEIALAFGCTAAPPAPFYPTVTVAGNRVSIGWSEPAFGDPTYYVIEAGTAAGRTDLARVTTLAPAPFEAVAPDGTYFVRVRAGNACGLSDPSSDVSLTVGTGATVPAAPAWTTATVSGASVVLTWAPVAGATGYLVEAGTAPTLVNAAQVPVDGTRLQAAAVATGIYSVRVRAVSAAGLGPPGQEVGLAVTSSR